jgi:hypothetical protein
MNSNIIDRINKSKQSVPEGSRVLGHVFGVERWSTPPDGVRSLEHTFGPIFNASVILSTLIINTAIYGRCW